MGEVPLVQVLLDFKAEAAGVRFNKMVGAPVSDDGEGEEDEEEDDPLEQLDEYGRIKRAEEALEEEKELKEDLMEWCEPDCAAGFEILAHYLQEFSYKKVHLKCRYDAGRVLTAEAGRNPDTFKLKPEWSDLFLWAVLLSQQELAKTLWTQCEDPLRLALLASLLCKQLISKLDDGIEKDELREQADAYEEWASLLLEEASNPSDAALLLLAQPVLGFTAIEAKKEGKKKRTEHKLWPTSSIELAIGCATRP